MSNILITGVAGFIGNTLAENLLESGHKVTGIDNGYTGRAENIIKLSAYRNFHYIEYDVTDDSVINHPSLQPIKMIYHLASPASPKWYQAAPFETITVNTLGTKYMLELAKINDAKLLYSSTSEIYGNPNQHPQEESYNGNVNTWGPRACYDESKRLGEVYCYLYHSLYNTKVTVARIFNSYSAGLWKKDGRVMSNFVMQALKGEDITVYGDGKQTRTFCYVEDTIAGLKKMMTNEIANGEIFNIGHPQEYTITEVAELVKSLTHSSSTIVYKDLPVDDPQKRCPDITKAKELLGWQPKISLIEGLKRMISEYRNDL
ncbi:NAD-dependent epimerase/dehydratase family protein [Pseudalkalibacillus berkeleyi]|uniref:GDP-mannose 4,6-dehydratase n=1 Tax=Pseudalkalibacillus berkeleyi TaxID=1069813 RepID=A0ABS9GZ46_9BACL|nr:NAD-dependent epimerase/dehydratase family protein [Pseudalkalibacillus berkeleyi]MCF6136880.1 GDP-mannose 4,6-dehydratase [Pseudalkalibacillus berkeleyi]